MIINVAIAIARVVRPKVVGEFTRNPGDFGN
jgi:hypothetical protein